MDSSNANDAIAHSSSLLSCPDSLAFALLGGRHARFQHARPVHTEELLNVWHSMRIVSPYVVPVTD